MIAKDDKLIVIKKVMGFLNEGDIVKVTNVNESGFISFVFGEDFTCKGLMSFNKVKEYFKKYEEKKNLKITKEKIDEIICNSKLSTQTIFDKCIVVACQLPNGFTIVESFVFVDPSNYDEETGVKICLSRIADKVWELESYKIQDYYNYNNSAE